MKSLYILVLGMRGSGKTTLIRGHPQYTDGLIKYLPKPVYILDLVDNFNVGKIFESAEHFRKYKIAEAKQKVEPPKYYTLKKKVPDQENYYLQAIHRGKLSGSIVVDEAHQLCTPRSKNEFVDSIVQIGRNRNQTLVLSARRAAQLHKDWRTQVEVAISYRQQDRDDIRALKYVDPNAEKVKRLKRGQHNYEILGYYDDCPWFKKFIESEKKVGNYNA